MKELNENSSRKYHIELSYGYALLDKTIKNEIDFINAADKELYLAKASKKEHI